jgi:hypothetical protein
MKKLIVESIQKNRPILAAMLDGCSVETEVRPENGWVTLNLTAPNSYFHEQLSSPSVWPQIHEHIAELLGHDFTLNFAGVCDE